jgi:hypothetical protein
VRRVFAFACLVGLLASVPAGAGAQVIFSDDFGTWPDYDFGNDDWEPPGGWTMTDGAEDASDSYGGVTHFCGEVNAPGRGGDADRAFKVWRHGTFYYDYCGELAYAEADLHGYREIYNRWTMKIPADFSLAGGACHMNYLKLWRFIVGDSTGCILANWCGPGAFEIYLNINGASFEEAVMEIGKSIDPGAGWHTLLSIDEVRDGRWHSYELRIKLNDPGTANGEIRFWLDGAERFSVTALDYGATDVDAFSKAALGVCNTGARDCTPTGLFQEDWRAIEFDDYVLGTAYIGPVDVAAPDEDAPETVVEDSLSEAADDAEPGHDASADEPALDPTPDPAEEREEGGSGCGCRMVG